MNTRISFTILAFAITALLLPQEQLAQDNSESKEQKGKPTTTISFRDDFEKGAGQWEFYKKRGMKPLADDGRIVDSNDPLHGKVLSMPTGDMIALIKKSDGWNRYKVEGEVCFPKSKASLMGLVYHLNLVPRPNHKDPEKNLRTEFGSIYIKCGGSYIRVNPHYDGTAGRALYEELRTPLTGEAAIELKKWKRFKYEVVGPACHVYVADMNTPKVTFNDYHYSSGRVGFRPRSGGSEFWLDNVTIESIEELSYQGPVLPKSVSYAPEKMLTKWSALGPFQKRIKGVEEKRYSPDEKYVEDGLESGWTPFPTDTRGCVLSGKLCDFQFARGKPGRPKTATTPTSPTAKKFAYFHTALTSTKNRDVTIQFSSRSELTVFINGKLAGQIKPVGHIWYDFWKKKRHKPTKIKVSLEQGENHLVVLVNGGKYPGDGFYAYCQTETDIGTQDKKKEKNND